MLQPKLLLKKNPTFTKIVKRYLPQFTYWAGAIIVLQHFQFAPKHIKRRRAFHIFRQTIPKERANKT